MKKIINRKTGEPLTIQEARTLHRVLTNLGVTCIEHRSVYGYPTPEMAEKATLRDALDRYEGYTFAYAGTENVTFEGYKVLVICIKKLPSSTFEKNFPNLVVIGE